MVDIEGHAPDPIYAGQTASASGVDLGICDFIILTYKRTATIVIDGITTHPTFVNQQTAALTRVDQSHVTYTFPDFGITGSGTVSIPAQAHYTLSGQSHVTDAFPVDVEAVPDASTPVVPPITYGYDIPNVDYLGPGGGVVMWKFTDPYDTDPDTNTATFPVNPNAMTTPWPQRNITTVAVTAVDGQTIFTEGQPKPVDWTWSGWINTPYHYDLLRSWVYERRRRIIITDHFGRNITCVLTQFDAVPEMKNNVYWRHTYTVHALVASVGKPTKIPS